MKNEKKIISVVVPCYNEEKNIEALYEAIKDQFVKYLENYDYELIFIDNKSKDNTRNVIRKCCEKDRRVKAIFNICNFGQNNSPYYALCQSSGDCAIGMCADFQDPVELIPTMVHAWESGHKVVCMIKTSSQENRLKYLMRSLYYKAIHKMSQVRQIEHFTGFGLYDRSFINILRQLKEVTPFFRGIVAEYAPDHLEIPYEQMKRRAGKSCNNFFTLYDLAMLSFTSYTKSGMRIATFVGLLMSVLSTFIGIFYLILKIIFWEEFAMGNAPLLVGVFFIGGIQLAFMGLLAEYIMSMNVRLMGRPLVIEEERLNF